VHPSSGQSLAFVSALPDDLAGPWERVISGQA